MVLNVWPGISLQVFRQCGTAVDSILQAPTSGQEDHPLFTLLCFRE